MVARISLSIVVVGCFIVTTGVQACSVFHVGLRVIVVGVCIHATEVLTQGFLVAGVGLGIVVVRIHIVAAGVQTLCRLIAGVGLWVVVVRSLIHTTAVQTAAVVEVRRGVVVVRRFIGTTVVDTTEVVKVGRRVIVRGILVGTPACNWRERQLDIGVLVELVICTLKLDVVAQEHDTACGELTDQQFTFCIRHTLCI